MSRDRIPELLTLDPEVTAPKEYFELFKGATRRQRRSQIYKAGKNIANVYRDLCSGGPLMHGFEPMRVKLVSDSDGGVRFKEACEEDFFAIITPTESFNLVENIQRDTISSPYFIKGIGEQYEVQFSAVTVANRILVDAKYDKTDGYDYQVTGYDGEIPFIYTPGEMKFRPELSGCIIALSLAEVDDRPIFI